jgi:hypothetical protein
MNKIGEDVGHIQRIVNTAQGGKIWPTCRALIEGYILSLV